MPTLQIALLGGVRVQDDHGELDIGPAKCQAVLAALALSPRTAVSVAELIRAVWDDDPPRTADKTLQSYVVRLRKAVGPTTIVRVGAAYQLDVDPAAIDVTRFQRHLAAGDVTAALAEWGGTPLAGLESPALRPAVDGLVESWLGAVERDLDQRVADDPESALADLTELTSRHPFRERLWELLMVALYRAGRQADALAAFQVARGHLVDELGVDPGPRLQRVEAAILRQSTILLDGDRAPPDGAPGPSPPIPEDAAGALPRPLTRLVGRDDDRRRVGMALDRAAVLTLVGSGGVGKTRLALEVARTRTTDPDTGAWFVPLDEVRAAQDVDRAVAGAVGAREVAGRDVRTAVLARLRERRGIVLLDNCEHVLDGAAAIALAVASTCEGIQVLATSREALAIGGEHLVQLGPLDPAHGPELFADRAMAVRPDFDLDEERHAVEEICRRLDGLPLAIELAAGRVGTLTATEIVDRLDRRLELLAGHRRDRHHRQRTLRATLQWSYDLLDHREQHVLARLSAFTGPFDAAAARHVAWPDEAPDLDVAAVDDLLGQLTRRSLLMVRFDSRGKRYRLLETVRQFSAEILADGEEATATMQRHALWCHAEARRLRQLLEGPDELEGAAGAVELWPNLRAAFDRAVAAGDADLAAAVARPLASELAMRGRLEVGEWAEQLLPLLDDEDEDSRLTWLLWATQRLAELGDADGLDRLVARHGHGDHPVVRHARALVTPGDTTMVDASREAVAWLRGRGEEYLADWMQLVGVAAGLLRAGAFAEHDRYVAELTNRHREGGPPTFLHWSLFMRAYSALLRGDYPAAEQLFDASAAIPVPDGTFSANGPATARAAFRSGDHREGLRLLRDHITELLETDLSFVASRLAALEFITMHAAVGRLDAAAVVLGFFRETGDFGALAIDTVAADAASKITTDPEHTASIERGAGMDHLDALAFMRDILNDDLRQDALRHRG
ncbi:BTAD domain-containing putative transcriptional regulator [Salsipaludibacter albus]|uniref:BTAD domain-containing putative transcriptional regulator n=1 Tax=Salsipaludibacter albus TaxID=2849650 RepID=UPI001EE3A4B2